MLTPVPFRKQHLADLSHDKAAEMLCTPLVGELEKYPAFSWADSQGHVVACGGMHPIWPGRWGTWAFLEPCTGRHMLRIARFVKTVIELHPVPRLEAQVLVGFAQGIKFVKVLGMTQETSAPMRKWTPDGQDVHQFALVRDL